MGVQLGDIAPRKNILISDLNGRKIAIDAFNSIYQFLAIIRQPDGTPLMDSKGRVTSHLSGLLYRTGKLIEEGVMPAYVFDGEPPKLKWGVVEERAKVREEATAKWKKALREGETEEARMYAQQSSKLTNEMLEDSKKLLEAMGVPYVQAPSEGEAQAAHMAKRGDVWASASQDYDSLLFGSSQLVRNLAITGRRKVPRKNMYVNVEPELFVLDEVLKELGITREKLVEIGILIGTDYNEGIKGIGPKKALALIKEGRSLRSIFKEHEVEAELEELKEMFLKPKVIDKYKLEWKGPSKDRVIKILVDEHEFSIDRVEKVIDNLEKAATQKATQSRLDKWW